MQDVFSLTTNTVQINAQLRQPALGILLCSPSQRNDPQAPQHHSVPPHTHMCAPLTGQSPSARVCPGRAGRRRGPLDP